MIDDWKNEKVAVVYEHWELQQLMLQDAHQLARGCGPAG